MALLGVGAAASLWAQQDPLSFSAGVELVQVEVRVTDDGRPVTDLTLEDFVLEEDGEEQAISVMEFVGGHPGVAADGTRLKPADADPLDAAGDPEAPPDRYTWLYILPEVRHAQELEKMRDSIATFIRRDMPPGFLVSLAGLPFTNDRQLLLASLDRMLADSSEGIDPMLELLDDLAFERSMATALLRQNGAAPSFVGLSRDPGRTTPTSDVVLRADDYRGLVSVERIDRQLIFYGRLALLRYLDLIEKMTALPGKKMVLLYRSGLRVEVEHGEVMEEIAAAALRHRVSVFTVDPGGLRAPSPFDAEDGFAFDFDPRRRMAQPDTISRVVSELDPKNGLATLATATGGRSLVDSNALDGILEDVLEESSNYYVLGYRPENPDQDGRFRDVKVKVRRKGLKVRAARGYYEPRSFERQSTEQKELALYRTLRGGSPSDIAIQSDLNFFAADDGKTAMILSAAATPHDLDPSRKEFKATSLLRIGNMVLFDSMPIYHEQSLETAVDGAKPPRVAYNARIDLSPGRYSLRLVVRDDDSGQMGTLERSFEVPNLEGRSVPSSLLLTRRVQPNGDGQASEEAGARHNAVLDVGNMRPTPEVIRGFRQGDIIHGVYHLYRPTEADKSAAVRGIQLGLVRDGEWLKAGEVVAGGQAFPDEANDRIGFFSWVDTSRLEPGRYTLLAILPNYASRRVPHLAKTFELLPRDEPTPVAQLGTPH